MFYVRAFLGYFGCGYSPVDQSAGSWTPVRLWQSALRVFTHQRRGHFLYRRWFVLVSRHSGHSAPGFCRVATLGRCWWWRVVSSDRSGQVSGMRTYAGAARRRVHFTTVILRLPSGHRPGRHHACIPDQTRTRPVVLITTQQKWTPLNNSKKFRNVTVE